MKTTPKRKAAELMASFVNEAKAFWIEKNKEEMTEAEEEKVNVQIDKYAERIYKILKA